MNGIRANWSTGRESTRIRGTATNPSWETVKDALLLAKDDSGVVALEFFPPPDVGVQSIQVHTEKGNSVLMLSVDTGEDHEVRDYTNPASRAGVMVEVLGDFWDERLVCDNYDVVVDCFNQFLTNGDVSLDLLR